MNFGELQFWLHLFFGLGACLLVRRVATSAGRSTFGGDFIQYYDQVVLLALSLSFLLAVSFVSFSIFVAVSLVTYFGLHLITRHSVGGVCYLWLLVPIQLSPLLVFKYGGFGFDIATGNVPQVFAEIVIPVGISFYTFQLIGFSVDTLVRRSVMPGFLEFMNFGSFFPQLVAGPIERRENLLPQIRAFSFSALNWESVGKGLPWVITGLFMKLVLADNLAVYFRTTELVNPYVTWINNLVFGFRIYYDFAGYSLVALGVARALGVQLTLNFTSPYLASSISSFWRSWHITLSQWFRDYVYIPLGGGRSGYWACSVFLVFLVSGIWHGAGWNFILWGAAHACLLIMQRWVSENFRLSFGPLMGWCMTLLAVFFTWLLFYETRAGVLKGKVLGLLDPRLYGMNEFRAALSGFGSGDLFSLAVLIALCTVLLLFEWCSLQKLREPYGLLRRPAFLMAQVAAIVLLTPTSTNDFIYFAF